MPLREYSCGECGKGFTELKPGFSPPKKAVCKNCGGVALLKLSTVSVTHPKEAMKATNPKLDVVIGQGAERLRSHYRARKELRKEAEETSGGRGVIQDKDGSFRPLTEGESKIRKAAFTAVSKQE